MTSSWSTSIAAFLVSPLQPTTEQVEWVGQDHLQPKPPIRDSGEEGNSRHVYALKQGSRNLGASWGLR